MILSIKYIQNWYTLQDIQIFDRISQSTKQLIDSYLLTMKKKSVIFSGSKQIPQRNTFYPRKICKYLQKYLILSECFEFVLKIIIKNTLTSHAKRQNFNRAANFVSAPYFVLYRTPPFLRQKHTSEHLFLQNSSQWLHSNASYFFRKGKNRKTFSYLQKQSSGGVL